VSTDRQLDLFVALIGDVPFRDEREAMSALLVALSKNKRTRIEWEGPSGQRRLVTAPDEYGVATIRDYDVLLWAISQINEAVNAGLPVSPRVRLHPCNLLSAVGRDTSSKGDAELKAALHRLRATGVACESPALEEKRRKFGAFNLLSAFQIEASDDGNARGAWLQLSKWLFEAVTGDRDALAISPKYFEPTSGPDRFPYRLARRHAGKQSGWIVTFRDRHGRSGSSRNRGDFARDLRKAMTCTTLPEYPLRKTEGANGPSLSINRGPARIDWPQDRRNRL